MTQHLYVVQGNEVLKKLFWLWINEVVSCIAIISCPERLKKKSRALCFCFLYLNLTFQTQATAKTKQLFCATCEDL